MTSPASASRPDNFLGLNVTGNRLFGNPPQNATYVCVWEARIGRLLGSVSTEFAASLASAANAFASGAKDVLNSMDEKFCLVLEPDITFIVVTVEAVELVWDLKGAASQVVLPAGLRFDSNNLPGEEYASVRSLTIPKIQIRSLLAKHMSRRPIEWYEVASGSFDVHLDAYSCPPSWKIIAAQQKAFVQRQDFATRRVAWMYGSTVPGGSFFVQCCCLTLNLMRCNRISKRSRATFALSS